MIVRGEARAPMLSRLVVEALVKLGLSQEEILDGPIVHTTLPWQIPPLVIEATIFEVPFSDYIDIPMYVNPSRLVSLWSDALCFMRNKPDTVVTHNGYTNSSYAIPNVRLNERALHLSLPDGFPGGITDYAAITLSLECAHLLRHNAQVEKFVDNDDDYYAVLPDASEVGVKEGLPTMWTEQWDLPVTGMVQEMLRTPRGAVWEGCDHDIIAKVRSVCHDYQASMPDFEAVDWCLQSLRVIQGQKELLTAIRRIKVVAYERNLKGQHLKEALEISKSFAITDRQRVSALKNLLVPHVISPAAFTKRIYSCYAIPPAMLSDKALLKLQTGVQALYDNETRLYGRKGTL